MAATATLTRNNTSVTIPLRQESGMSSPIIADFGRPNLDVWETGSLNPRFNDQWSGLEQLTISGRYLSSADYTTTHTLAELIKSCSGGDPLRLSTTLDQFEDGIQVAPAAGQDGALTLGYQPGEKGIVEVDLALTRVQRTLGSITQQATTPTASGSGPIELSNGATTVALESDVAVTRSVGRPNSTVRRSPDAYPTLVDKAKSATDTFELRTVYTQNNVSTIQTIRDEIITPKLGRTPLTLDFNGLFGYGAFAVVPDGSQAFRHDAPAGATGLSRVPTIQLRRVLSP